MYNELINNQVVVLVTTRGEMLFEYTGLLSEENDKTIKLKNAEINVAMLNFQKNIFGGNMSSYKQNIQEIIINKDYIISCNKNNY